MSVVLLPHIPTQLFLGENCIVKNSSALASLGSTCLIVTGASSAKKCGALEDVLTALQAEQISYRIYDGIAQNPTLESCVEAGRLAAEFGAEFILGIGGGSPMDAAKAIAVIAKNPTLSTADLYSYHWEECLPIVAVGTTAGTGSEVTPVAVITTDGKKKSLRHDKMYPALAFGDAKYTASLSDVFTRSTAIDAMAHCLESYFNRQATEASRQAALKGIGLLLQVFPKMEQNLPLSSCDREILYEASLYGGVAISVTGTAFPHAMGYFLSEDHGIAHGTACALYLPSFLEHNAKADPDGVARLVRETGWEISSLSALISAITPDVSVTVSAQERADLAPRWVKNKSLEKTLGDFSSEDADRLIANLFSSL